MGSRSGTPSGNLRFTSSTVFRRSSRWSIDLRSFGNCTLAELRASIVAIVTGTTSIRPSFALIPEGPGASAAKSLCFIRGPFLNTADDASIHNATSTMKLSWGENSAS